MVNKPIFLILLGTVFLPFSLLGAPLEPVTLQLRWLHQFQFAGYYMAKEKGYYRDAGLDVSIKEANRLHSSPVEEVINGRAQYGIGNSGLINERANGKPVVVLASIFQTSPNVWLVRKDSNISTVVDMVHKRLMMTKNIENTELLALFHNEGINYNKLNIVDSSFDVNDIINRKVDAFNAYATNEPYFLKKRGIDYLTINPRKYGIDFYSDCLFTSDQELSRHPERVKAFRQASLKGWEYAMKHPEEAIDLILTKYSQAKTRDHLQFEAEEIHKLMEPELIEIGHMNPARWAYIAQMYHTLGFSASPQIPDGFLYNPNQTKDMTWLYYALAITLVLLVIIGSVTWYIFRLNTRIKQQSLHDPLTGLYNRRYLDETFTRELARAQRESYPISFVMVDLDHFKHVNDTCGHTAGDEVLKQVAKCLTSITRQNDFICRYGGEEFIVVMPGMPLKQAYERMEECRIIMEKTRLACNTEEISVTLSAGVTAFPDCADTLDELLKSADHALYTSKENGRNQITLSKYKER